MGPKRVKDVDDAAAEEILGDRDNLYDDEDRLRHQAARQSAGRAGLSDEELREDDLDRAGHATPGEDRNLDETSEAERLNRRMSAPEDERQRRIEADEETAATPASGAAVQRAEAGAALSGEGRPREDSETARALRRAAQPDGRR